MADVLEPQTVETSPEPPLPEAPLQNERKPKYPPALMAEYRVLTTKHLMGGLTPTEATRLQCLMDQIAAIDLTDPMMQVRQAVMAELRRELEELRSKVNALAEKK